MCNKATSRARSIFLLICGLVLIPLAIYHYFSDGDEEKALFAIGALALALSFYWAMSTIFLHRSALQKGQRLQVINTVGAIAVSLLVIVGLFSAKHIARLAWLAVYLIAGGTFLWASVLMWHGEN